MRLYEVLFILSPQMAEEDAEAAALSLQKTVEKKGATVVNVEKWGKRRLAYAVKKQREGYYYLFIVNGDAAAINELERKFKQTDEVMRFLTVRTDLEQKAVAKRIKQRQAEEQKRASRREGSAESGSGTHSAGE
jgi:small subunit ribosomal protein S6